MSANEPPVVKGHSKFFVEWGFSIDPIGAGEDFPQAECPDGSERRMFWYVAKPEQAQRFDSLGSIESRLTKGGRSLTHWAPSAESAVYNYIVDLDPDDVEDMDKIWAYLIGMDVCVQKARVTSESGDTSHIEWVPVDNRWVERDSKYQRRGGVPGDRTVTYRVERVDGVPYEQIPSFSDVIDPLQQFGVEQAPPSDTFTDNPAEYPDVDRVIGSGGGVTAIEDSADPEPAVEFDEPTIPGAPGSGKTTTINDNDTTDSASTADTADRTDTTGSTDTEDSGSEDIDLTVDDIDDLSYNEKQTIASDLGMPGGVIGVSGDDIDAFLRDNLPSASETEFGSGGDPSLAEGMDVGSNDDEESVSSEAEFGDPSLAEGRDVGGDDDDDGGSGYSDDDLVDANINIDTELPIGVLKTILTDNGPDSVSIGSDPSIDLDEFEMEVDSAIDDAVGTEDDPWFGVPIGQGILMTTENCPACARMKADPDMQEELEAGTTTEVSPSTKPALWNYLLDQVDRSTAPIFLVHRGGGEFEEPA